MAKGDVSGVAGVNSYNSLHPVRTMDCWVTRITFFDPGMALIYFFFSENSLYLDYLASKPKQKWISDEQNWNVHSESMEETEVLPQSSPQILLLPLWKWKPSEWPTWLLQKCQTSTESAEPAVRDTKLFKKNVRRKRQKSRESRKKIMKAGR
jgi:hypothetical protein